MTRNKNIAGRAGEVVFTLALVAHLGVIADGKMGVSLERAKRIRTATEAQKQARKS